MLYAITNAFNVHNNNIQGIHEFGLVALAQIACIVVSQLLEYNTPLKTLGPWVPSSQVSECHKNFGYPSENGDPLLPLPHDFTTSVPYPNLSLSI